LSNVFYREPLHEYPRIERGRGVFLYDADGREYLDGSGGAAVSAVGHGHPAVLAAIHDQLDRCAFAHTAFFTNAPQEALAKLLAARFPEPSSRVYFVSGGSEAGSSRKGTRTTQSAAPTSSSQRTSTSGVCACGLRA
jgi:adenosylmethionine-8-amino-7-oxononanoate aminotransferase